MTRSRRSPLRNAIVLIAGVFAFWQIAYWIVGDVALRSPWQTMRFTVELTHAHMFWLHLANTLQAFAAALAIAIVLGLLIGFGLGLHRLSADALEPMLVALYSIPKITLYPVLFWSSGWACRRRSHSVRSTGSSRSPCSPSTRSAASGPSC